MSDTEIQAVDPPAPDANVETVEVETPADPSPAVKDADDKPKGVGKRIDELTRNWRETERDRDYWRDLALRYTQQPKVETPAPQETKLKTLADFDYDEAKFQSYLFDEAQKRSVEAARRELEQERERQTKSQRLSSFKSREAEFAKSVEDYDAVVRNPHLPITEAMVEVIQESDDGPALAYHLGKNPDIAEKISKLPPIAAARELGKIEARLAYEREKAKEKPVVSKAPPPPPKVDASQPAIEKDPDEMSTDEWLKWRQKQLRKKA